MALRFVVRHQKNKEPIMSVIVDSFKRELPAPIKQVLKRIVARLRNRPFKPYLKKKNVEGVVFDFWIGDRDGRDWYDLQCTDPVWREMRFIKDHIISPGDVVLECGGHHGCTAIILSNWVGVTGRVVTFEPSPPNCDIIEKNILQNGLRNVTLERKAVGAERGGATTISDQSNSHITLSGDGRKVELTCLDEYAHMRPSFLKIDVEGFEMQVLQGAKKILSTRPKLAIEIHTETLSMYGASVQDLFRLICAENYKLWIQWEDGKEPEEYDLSTPIEKRVHLFGVPLVVNQPET
jgi:FkbM family methyltransferase